MSTPSATPRESQQARADPVLGTPPAAPVQFVGHARTPTVTDSLDHMVNAAQNVVGDQIGLLKFEVTTTMTALMMALLRAAAMALLGTAMLLIGWVIVLRAALQALEPRIGGVGAVASLVAVNVVLGVGLLMAAARARGEVRRG
jgi:hypothetical protein